MLQELHETTMNIMTSSGFDKINMTSCNIKKEMEKGHYNRERKSNTNESAMVETH